MARENLLAALKRVERNGGAAGMCCFRCQMGPCTLGAATGAERGTCGATVPETLAGTELVTACRRSTDRPAYFITSRGSDYLVTNSDPMTCLMLDYLLLEDREFRGGILVEGIFEHRERVDTRVAGTVDIKWIALGGPLYFRSS